MNKYLLLMLFTIFFINSCSYSKNIEENILKIKNLSFFSKKSKFILLNFDSAVENIILEMLKSNNIFIFNKTLFFIDTLENKTNIIIDKEKLTDLIKNKISKRAHQIYFIKKKIINKYKKKLRISNKTNSLDINTAMLLSRNNNAKYYLYSCISKKNECFLLTIELILVKTGEIIFIKKEKFYW